MAYIRLRIMHIYFSIKPVPCINEPRPSNSTPPFLIPAHLAQRLNANQNCLLSHRFSNAENLQKNRGYI